MTTDADRDPAASLGSVATEFASRAKAWRDERGYPTAGEMLDEAVSVIYSLRLTDEEREALTVACGDSSQWDRPHVATLLRLLERTRADARLAALDRLVAMDEELERDYPDQDNAPKQDTTPAHGSVPPEWMSRPFWVDPPQGHRYGFPKLYDRAFDGDMTKWMVANGYPQHLADKGLPCTFTATG